MLPLLLVLIALTLGLSQGQCPGRTDIILALPASDIVPGQEFFPFERFLINLVRYFQLSPDSVNIGLILYGREPVAISWPQPFKTEKQINTRITLMSQRELYMEQLAGGNDVAAAITLMRHMFRNPTGYPLQTARAGVQKIGVVFTYDGVAAVERMGVVDAAEAARTEGAVLYAIGKGRVGPEFGGIASDYCKGFSMGRFIDGLPSVLAYIGSSICTEMDSYVNVSSTNCFPQLYQPKRPEPVMCSRTSMIFQDPENCAYFYHCLFQKPVREQCPPDMLFDPIALSCNMKHHVQCYTDISCPVKEGLFPHPTECNKYVNCFDFRPYVQSCPENLWFDAATGGCEQAYSVACPMH